MKAPLAALGEVADFIRGITFKPDDIIELGAPNSVACLRTKNVQADLDLTDVWALPESFVKSPDRLARQGDVILSTANSWNLVGKASWIPELPWPTTAGGFVSLLRAKSERLDARYMYHWTSSPLTQARLRKCARRTTNISNLSIPQAKELTIPLPPLEEQKRIAGILDQAAELYRLRTRALDKLGTLGQAIFHEMFGDPVTHATATLVDIVTKGDKINYGVVQPGDDVVEGIPLLRAGDILSPGLDPKDFRRVAAEVDAKHKKSRLKGDEILIACVGSIGSVALAHQGLKGVNIARAVARVPVDKKLANRVFIASQLKSQAVQNYFRREIRLVAQPTLNIKQITEAPIFLPSLALQEEFAARLSALDGNIGKAVLSMRKAEALFASLQHRAFRGEL